MELHKRVTAFLSEILRMRQMLQEERRLTDSEHQILKASLEALLLDVEANAKHKSEPH